MAFTNKDFRDAAYNGDFPLLKTIWESGDIKDINVISDDAAALHWAAIRGPVESIAYLLDHGADIDLLTAPDGGTPLFCAVAWNNPQSVYYLLEKGANALLMYNNKTPEQEAVEKKYTEIAKALHYHVTNRPDMVIRVSNIGVCDIEEVFHFEKMERFTIVRDPKTGAVQALTRDRFSKLDEDELRDIFAEHAKRGGLKTLADIQAPLSAKSFTRKRGPASD